MGEGSILSKKDANYLFEMIKHEKPHILYLNNNKVRVNAVWNLNDKVDYLSSFLNVLESNYDFDCRIVNTDEGEDYVCDLGGLKNNELPFIDSDSDVLKLKNGIISFDLEVNNENIKKIIYLFYNFKNKKN